MPINYHLIYANFKQKYILNLSISLYHKLELLPSFIPCNYDSKLCTKFLYLFMTAYDNTIKCT